MNGAWTNARAWTTRWHRPTASCKTRWTPSRSPSTNGSANRPARLGSGDSERELGKAPHARGPGFQLKQTSRGVLNRDPGGRSLAPPRPKRRQPLFRKNLSQQDELIATTLPKPYECDPTFPVPAPARFARFPVVYVHLYRLFAT